MAAVQLRGSLYINGRWCEADSGRAIDVINPATEEVACQVACCGRAETERAIDAAHKAFAAWRALTPYERAAPLRKTADLIRRRVTALIEGMKQRGARYVYASDHSISTLVDYDSFRYALDVYREHMTY